MPNYLLNHQENKIQSYKIVFFSLSLIEQKRSLKSERSYRQAYVQSEIRNKISDC